MPDIGAFLRIVCASLCTFVVARSSSAEPLPRKGVFIYSNLWWEQGGGDPAGYRVTIDRSSGIDGLYFEWSEGGLMGSHATMLTIQPNTGALDFTILPDGWPSDRQPAYRYTGRITKESVFLTRVDLGDGSGFRAVGDKMRALPLVLPSRSKDLPTCR